MNDKGDTILAIIATIIVIGALSLYLAIWWSDCGGKTISEAPVWCIVR